MGALAAYAPFLKESPACRAAARLGGKAASVSSPRPGFLLCGNTMFLQRVLYYAAIHSHKSSAVRRILHFRTAQPNIESKRQI